MNGPDPVVKPRILIADDNAINLKMLAYHLEMMKLDFDAVGSGGQALEALLSGRYTLAFLDCLMPDRDGYEVSLHLRRELDPGLRELVIIGVTTTGKGNDEARCLEAGMNALLEKPVRRAALEACLKKWLPNTNPLQE